MKLQNLFSLTIMAAVLWSCGGNEQQTAESETSSAEAVTAVNTESDGDNTLTDEEKQQGWELLFDGNSTDQWRGAHQDAFPEKGWHVEDGMLVVEEASGEESGNGGDIVTQDEYTDFEFSLDFKITEGANSGIKYYVTEQYNSGKSAIGLEYQVLDDEKHPDAKLGNNGGDTRTAASLYDLIAAPQTKAINPVGEWNHARIVSLDGQVEHWLNGEKVLEYDRFSEEFKQKIQDSKYKDWEGFGVWESGHLLLQDHGNRVYFKNIKVRELPAS
ncbi:3-keto-disaccharide hydrolase [Catalinimonas niigatensis]|uniref:3-keto-disaccharide hydrolase n=1 Tax=Catalinimonas niigatensis TaxID=1397264 RepID=UPI002666AF70|nr:DUF1080 domain-containing protein [Catalinimonas niigatensis]WPP51217.1 DUF1080 domain-containing protein [Catalinimonas niigatensis]